MQFMPPRFLIAVITCEKFSARANAQRETWVPLVEGADVRFFLAKQDREPLSDEVFLDCSDDYAALPRKVQLMLQWAIAQDYFMVLKTDDDTYIFPDRLFENIPTTSYSGCYQPYDGGFCAGFAYWLDRKAMAMIARTDITDAIAEDRWVGRVMLDRGVKAKHIPEFVLADQTPRYFCVKSDTQVACEFEPKEMKLVHNTSLQPKGWRARKQRVDSQRQCRLMRGNGQPFFA